MSTRRGFLALLGLAAPAAVLAPKIAAQVKPFPPMAHPTGIPFADPPDPAGVILDDANQAPMRYLGLAQLKNEGEPLSLDISDPDEISRFAREAFGRKELYQWPESPDWHDEEDPS